jgi:predicted nucleic acid-binding protein
VILVDTSVWIDFFRGRKILSTDKLENCLLSDEVITADIILLEIFQGIGSKREWDKINLAFSEIPCENVLGKQNALSAATKYRLLRNKGVTVKKTADLLIASFCIDRGIFLLQNDSDFLPFAKYLNLALL